MRFYTNQLVYYKGSYALIEKYNSEDKSYQLEGYKDAVPREHLLALTEEDFRSEYFRSLPVELRAINAARYQQKALLGEMLLKQELALITHQNQQALLADHQQLVLLLQRLYQTFGAMFEPDNLAFMMSFIEIKPPKEQGDEPKHSFKFGKLMKEIPKLPFKKGKLHALFTQFRPEYLFDLDKDALLALAAKHGMDVQHIVEEVEQQRQAVHQDAPT